MTRSATEILERRRAAAAAGAFPFDGPFERLAEGMTFTTAARPVQDTEAFALLSQAARLVPLDRGRVTLRRVADVVFRRPVAAGDELHVEGRVEALAPGGEDAGQVTLAWSLVDQAGRCVCRARVELEWAREESFVAIPL
jgi:acyl dehydratase